MNCSPYYKHHLCFYYMWIIFRSFLHSCRLDSSFKRKILWWEAGWGKIFFLKLFCMIASKSQNLSLVAASHILRVVGSLLGFLVMTWQLLVLPYKTSVPFWEHPVPRIRNKSFQTNDIQQSQLRDSFQIPLHLNCVSKELNAKIFCEWIGPQWRKLVNGAQKLII